MTEQKFDEESLGELFAQVAYRMKESMSDMHSALLRIAPPEKREENRTLDENTAVLLRSFYRLCRLAGNLEEATRLKAPSSVVFFRNDDIVGLVRAVTERASEPAELLGLTLTFQCTDTSCIIAMDSIRIERMLLNLLSNAFKFTPPGGHIRVELCVKELEVEIRVRDTGCGIPADRLDTIYDRYRCTDFPEDIPSGLGLGLPIARRIAEDHGGSLVHIVPRDGGTLAIATLSKKRVSAVEMNVPITIDYSGGFDRTLLELSDALPVKMFRSRMMD